MSNIPDVGINFKAELDPSGFVQGSERVVTSAREEQSALESLQLSTERLLAIRQKSLESIETESPATAKARLASNRVLFEHYADEAGELLSKHPELEQSSAALAYERIAEQGLPKNVTSPLQSQPQMATERLGEIVGEKLARITEAPKDERQQLYTETKPFIQEYQSRLNKEFQSAFRGQIAETARFESLTPEEQAKQVETFTKTIQNLEDRATKASRGLKELAESTKEVSKEAGEAGRGSLPSYLASAVNMVATAGQSAAHLYQAGQLAFDYGSPMGMYSAEMGYDIMRRQTLWQMGGSMLGQVGGAVIGGMTGNPFIGSYLGGTIGGSLGDIIGTLSTTEDKVKLQRLNQLDARAGAMANQFAAVESSEVNLARFTGQDVDYVSSVAKSYGKYGLDQLSTLQLQNQYAQSAGRFDDEGFDKWMQYFVRTGSLPTGEGLLARYTGIDQSDRLNAVMGEFGISGRNNPRTADINQFFLQNTAQAAQTFTNAADIERATTVMNWLPYNLYGEGTAQNSWAQQNGAQIVKAYSALGQARNPAEEAFLFNALRKEGDSWTDTVDRMDEGIWGEGNLSAILREAKKYGDAGGNLIWSILKQAGVAPSLRKDIISTFNETDEGVFDARVKQMEKTAQEQFGDAKISQTGKAKAEESISVNEQARGFSASYLSGLAQFNVEVAKIASSADTQNKIREMRDTVIRSITDAAMSDETRKNILHDASPAFMKESNKITTLPLYAEPAPKLNAPLGEYGNKEQLDRISHNENGQTVTQQVMARDKSGKNFLMDVQITVVDSSNPSQSSQRSRRPVGASGSWGD